jgi:UDP-glucose:(heptosyl)LPS alpha-1,3-glucosyltransferase
VKLALVRQTYTPFGGAERFVERALDGLRDQGVDVAVIARRWQGEPGPGFVRCNPFYLGRTWRDASFAKAVQGLIASGRYDLVQSHERIPGCHLYRAGDGVHVTWLELRAAARSRFAGLATALSPWHRWTLAAEAAMFAHPSLRAVICNSAMVRRDIAQRFGVAADKLHLIRNGVDLDHFHPGLRDLHRARLRSELSIPAAAPVLLFVGSGFERKGVFVLLRALAALVRPDVHLVVVGKDRDETVASKLAQTLGIDARVRFAGRQTDVRPYYGMADVFCLPTLYDPLPNAALEAFACGLPVVTTTTCGAAELIRPGTNGAVCAANDVAALAAALTPYLEPGTAAAQQAAARASIGSIDAMATQLRDLYRTLLPA